MGLQQFTAGPMDDSVTGRALKRLENLLGRTPAWGASRLVTAATTVIASDDLLLVNTTAGSVTITLPEASMVLGRRFTMKKMVAANTMTIDGNGAQTIDGAATQAVTVQYTALTVQAVILVAPATCGWVLV